MCGISGIAQRGQGIVNLRVLQSMTDSIAHRGPDGEGHWISNDTNVGFGHRRLAIIDVSDNGKQPMRWNDRYTITFNGEIYNYIELRDLLIKEGFHFRTASDTEVLLALYAYKKEACLDLIDGMFAFAIYDEEEQTLFCARDRFGEKPFYYAYDPGQSFIFGSEMKAIWAAGIPKKANDNMLFGYLIHGILENIEDKSATFYEGINRLEPAHYLKINLSDLSMTKRCYWMINLSPEIGNKIKFDDAAGQFRDLMEKSVRRRLRSDVPVGSSLSGGLDSSLIVCLVDQILSGTSQLQKTFSARFPGFAKDEGKYMELVINKTRVQPFFTYPDQRSMFDLLDKVSYHQEEPFGSASIMVQYQVMQLAKENNVIVLLDGQGADEILAGYHYYYPIYFRELKRLDKHSYKNAIGEFQQLHKDNVINKYESGKAWALDNFGGYANLFFKLSARYKQFKDGVIDKDFYRRNHSNVSLESKTKLYRFDSLNNSLHYSTFTKGLEELLRYADRNSMANSREVRLPFLSHKLVQFLFSLPAQYKIGEGWTKYLMRKAFNDLLPEEIAWRKDKIGYEPPQNSWLQAPEAKDRLEYSKELLFKNQILSKSGLSQTTDAIDSAGKWRYLMSANLFT